MDVIMCSDTNLGCLDPQKRDGGCQEIRVLVNLEIYKARDTATAIKTARHTYISAMMIQGRISIVRVSIRKSKKYTHTVCSYCIGGFQITTEDSCMTDDGDCYICMFDPVYRD